jgi:hypothetical protein
MHTEERADDRKNLWVSHHGEARRLLSFARRIASSDLIERFS